MDDHRTRLRAAAALGGGLLVIGLLLGCSSGSTTEEVAVPAATAATPTAGDAGATAPDAALAPTVPPAITLDRFTYTATLTMREVNPRGPLDQLRVSTEGRFVAPDRHQFTYTTQLGEARFTESLTLIGDQAWLREGEGPWRAASPADDEVLRVLSTAFSTVRPDFLGGPEFADVRENVRRLVASEETVNDILSDHYVVADEGREYFQSFVVPEVDAAALTDLRWEVWLARDGAWPVRLLAAGTIAADLKILERLGLDPPSDWQLQIDVLRPNDLSLSVSPPE